ncbi:MAG: hypothetical protein KDA52_08385, partial [Planctomycetaceae bacterium]|nr:hypothetical protein [Planctomycetaceae bacterium]
LTMPHGARIGPHDPSPLSRQEKGQGGHNWYVEMRTSVGVRSMTGTSLAVIYGCRPVLHPASRP